MADARLEELLEAKNELRRHRESIPLGTTPTAHKDLSLILVIPRWSRSDATATLEEFLESIESSGLMGRWSKNDPRDVAILKLMGAELHEEGATWQLFRDAFRQRYKDVHTDQYDVTKLQTARQSRNESPQEFADRCKGLAQKIIVK